jgi:arabinogalactan oligomer/maltooligosaccharide transport system substrate-binding protein
MRKAVTFFAALVLTLLLASCGGRADTGATAALADSAGGVPAAPAAAPADAPAAAADDAPGPVAGPASPVAVAPAARLIVWAEESLVPALERAGRLHRAATGVGVAVRPMSIAEVRAALPGKAPRGLGPDLFVGSGEWAGELASKGLIASLDIGDQAGSFRSVALGAFTYREKLYGVPISTRATALLRNTDLAPKEPGSLDAMVGRGLALVESGKADLPIALPMGKRGDARTWYPMYSGSGGFLFELTRNGTYHPDSHGVGHTSSVRAAQVLADLVRRGAVVPAVTARKALRSFTEGRSPYLIADVTAASAISQAGIPVAVGPVPGDRETRPDGRSLVFAEGLMLSAFARNAAEARAFLAERVMTTDVMDELTAPGTQVPAWDASFAAALDDPLVAAFDGVEQVGQPAPNLPYVAQVWQVLSRAQAAVMRGKDPAATLEQAEGQVEEIISSY